MKLLRKVGATSEIWQVFVADSSSTTGAGLAGLTNASSGLTAYYHRDTDTTATAISLASMTIGTFTSSGFKEIDATNMPGWYQFCPPNAALASGAKSCAFHLKGAANMAPLPIEVDLDPQVDVTSWNGTAVSSPATAGIPEVNVKNINNVAAATPGASGGVLIAGSNAATTFSGLTTGALSCTTITASGAVAFQSTFAVTTSTSLAALSCTTMTASGAVAFQSTFAVTTSTSLAALSATTVTFSGAVAFQSTFAVTTSTSLAALSCTTLTASGAVAFQYTFAVTTSTNLAALSCTTLTASGTVTYNAFTVTNAMTVSGTTTHTGAVSFGSTFGVTGTTTLNALTVTNATTLSGAVSLGSTLGVTGAITLSAAMAESYAAVGVAPTPFQALYAILQSLYEVSISGTTLTVKKIDGSTTAATETLNSATAPTSKTRAS